MLNKTRNIMSKVWYLPAPQHNPEFTRKNEPTVPHEARKHAHMIAFAYSSRSIVCTSLASHLWMYHRGTTHVIESHRDEPAATCGLYRAAIYGGGLAVRRCNIDYNVVCTGGCCSALCPAFLCCRHASESDGIKTYNKQSCTS